MNLLAKIARRRALEKICGKPKTAASRQGALDFGAEAPARAEGIGARHERMIERLAVTEKADGSAVELTTEADQETAARLRAHGYVDVATTTRGSRWPTRYYVQITEAGLEFAEKLKPIRPRKAAAKPATKKPATKKPVTKKKATKKKAAAKPDTKKKAAKKGPSKAALWWLSALNTAALDLAAKPELKRTASKGGAYFGNAKEKRGVRELVAHKLARITLETPASKGSVAAIYALPTPAGLRAYRGEAPKSRPGKKRAASTLRLDDKVRIKREGRDVTTDARIRSRGPKGKMIDFELEDAEGDRFMWSAAPAEKIEVIG